MNHHTCNQCKEHKPLNEYYTYTYKGVRRPVGRCKHCYKVTNDTKKYGEDKK